MPNRLLPAFLLTLLLFPGQLPAEPGDDAKSRPAALPKRVPWTTSNVKGTPDPPSPYRTEIAFPNLTFNEPLDIAAATGTDRLIVVERFGKLFSFPNDPATSQADLLLDLDQVLGRTEPKTIAAYGVATHPDFTSNGLVYVTYVIDLNETPDGTRLSRFKLLAGDPPRCDPQSEQILLTWPSGGHNGGCLAFGPDGYLYVATGDSSGIADQYLTGQDLTTLAGKILRIDVDRPDSSQPYSVPADNPFVGTEGARPEIWAYGLRQPWKISFDRATGQLWTGNVGQDLWEQIYLVERGGNYGWSVMEGSHPFRPERPRGPSPILMPIVEHDHANFRSITGGFVYHGQRLTDLVGAYIYGDYDTGRIWMLRYDSAAAEVVEHRELVASSLRLVGFAQDEAGELVLLDHMSGRISRLVPNRATNDPQKFPRRLSQTGLFASTDGLRPAPGVIPYSVIAPQWCDGATKERLLALPGTSQIEFEAITYPQPAPGAPPGWKFPDGTVLAETLFLEMEPGNPDSARRIETRILHHQRLTGSEEVGDQYWQGYTYIWDDDQSDAVLLEDPQGLDREFILRDGAAPGGSRRQTWHFPSRMECTACHNMAAKYALGMQTLQVNRDHDYGVLVANQLAAFDQLGLFTQSLPIPPDELPRLADYRDESHGIDLRARAYLHANCSHCHRKWGGGNAEFQLLATLELTDTGTLGVRPGQGTFNIPQARIIAAGDPYRSVLLYRMAKLGPGRMPRIASHKADEAAIALVHDWIQQLPAAGLLPTPSSLAASRQLDALRSGESASADQVAATVEELLSSTGAALQMAQAVAGDQFPPEVRQAIVDRAGKSATAEIRDLFERFLPEEERVQRLGSVVRPQEILALPGDAQRGRQLFFEVSGVQCRNCHRIGGMGTQVGPDLDQIGKKYDRARILDNILNPSNQIDPQYLTHLVETADGLVHSGIVISRDAEKVVLKDADNKLIEVPATEIALIVPQQKSLMPDLLLRDLTPQQVADLMELLSSLKDP